MKVNTFITICAAGFGGGMEIFMSDYPDWVEERWGNDIPNWVQERWRDNTDNYDDDDR